MDNVKGITLILIDNIASARILKLARWYIFAAVLPHGTVPNTQPFYRGDLETYPQSHICSPSIAIAFPFQGVRKSSLVQYRYCHITSMLFTARPLHINHMTYLIVMLLHFLVALLNFAITILIGMFICAFLLMIFFIKIALLKFIFFLENVVYI